MTECKQLAAIVPPIGTKVIVTVVIEDKTTEGIDDEESYKGEILCTPYVLQNRIRFSIKMNDGSTPAFTLGYVYIEEIEDGDDVSLLGAKFAGMRPLPLYMKKMT